MSVPFFGDYDTSETAVLTFNTFSSDDPSASVTITDLVAADVEIHKDGSTTQRASDNGVTVSINFDSVTGNHQIAIDLSDNSDAGYYANGSRIHVRIEGTTIDGATVNAWVGWFSIGCTLRPTTAGRKLDVTAGGCAGIDWANVEAPTTSVGLTNTTVGTVTLVDTCTTNTDMRGTDSAALAATALSNVTWTDARAGYLDELAAANIPADLDAVLADTNELQTNQGNWLTATGFSTHSAADVWSVGTRSLTDKADFGLADGAISAAKLGADAITAAKIADDALGGEHFASSFMQALAEIRHQTNGTIYHVAADGNDGNDGLSWESPKLTPKTVIEAASAGDLVLLGKGTFDLGSNRISIPDTVVVQCAGMHRTTLTSSRAASSGTIIYPGSGSRIRDCKIVGSGADSCVFGMNQTDASVTDVLAERVMFSATAESGKAIYIGSPASSGPCTFTFRDCLLNGRFENLDLQAGTDTPTYAQLLGCTIRCRSAVGGYNYMCGLDAYGATGTIVARGCDIDLENTDNSNVNGVLATSSGTVILTESTIRTRANTGTDLDINISGGAVLVDDSVDYDASKASSSGLTHRSRVVAAAALTAYDPPTNAEMVARTLAAAEYATLAKLLAYVQLMCRSDADIATDRATELGEINADQGSGPGDYDNAADSIEGLRDNGDSAWVSATSVSVGAGGISAESFDADAINNTAIDANAVTKITEGLAATLVTLGEAIEAIPGDNDLASINATVDTALADYDGPTKAEMDAAIPDLYHADIQLTVDATNSKDEYTATWFKNGVRVTSGITTPLIQVIKRADGTDLIAETAMSQIGSTGSYKYDEASNTVTAGEAVVVVVTGTIDGSARSFARVCTRDSSA